MCSCVRVVPVRAGKAANQFPILQKALLTKLFQTHVVEWDGGGRQEFWRSVWVVMHGEAGVPTPSHGGSSRPFQQRSRPEGGREG